MVDATGEKGRVLITDDEATSRILIGAALSQAGFEVAEAHDGEEAVAAFQAREPDILLMDLIMPVLDGFEATRRIRALPGGLDVPILVFTGLDDLESITHAYQAGATDFAPKPVNLAALPYRVRYMLRARKHLTDLRRGEASLRRAQQLAKLGSWELDLRTGQLTWSDQLYQILGLEPQASHPSRDALRNRIHPEDRERFDAAEAETLTKQRAQVVEFRATGADGKERILRQHTEIIAGDGRQPHLAAAAVQDVTEHRQAEERIQYLANYDALTGLPNRTLCADRLSQALALARRRSSEAAVLFLDLDRFKRINDTLGNAVGDRVLRATADRLRRCLREVDTVGRVEDTTVARLGGDEFLVVIGDLTRNVDAAKVARRVRQEVSQPLALDDEALTVTCSIGIAVFPDDGEDPDLLLRNAETAMHHSKRTGRNGFQYYNSSMNASSRDRLQLEQQLINAMERNELQLHYQPQVSADGAIVGCEALLRWYQPEVGFVPPAQFIPLAEEMGLMPALGDWVLRTACEHLERWHRRFEAAPRLAVNLSALQFQPEIATTISGLAASRRLDLGRLELEITESLLLDHSAETMATLHALKVLGLRITVDDFGTGYSSLRYLKDLPVDGLKIDRSFLRGIPGDVKQQKLVEAILAMAGALGLETTAEGVETREQADFLIERQCRLLQGYLISKPLPPGELEELLERATPLALV